MLKFLVTGGAGFIGSHTVDALLGSGHDVVCVDNETSVSAEKYYWNSGAQNLKFDICDSKSMLSAMSGVDFVIHLASSSRIGATMKDPVGAFRTNSLGTTVVLQCALESGVKRVVYASTSSAYGRNPAPNKEDQTPDPINPYSSSKVCGELACRVYSMSFGLETLSLRYFNVYGPRSPLKGQYAPVIGLFQRQRDEGKPLTVVGDGLQRRDFTHVYDVVRANIMASESPLDSETKGSVINIGSGKNISVLEIARAISKEVTFVPERKGEMRETLADVSKAQKKIGWRPTFRIEDYLSSIAKN